jgi:Ca-activated chloride channel family protein
MKAEYLIIAVCALSQIGASGSAARRVAQGNRLFEEKKYEEALTRYNEAQQELPESPKIFFNIGDVYYRQEGYDKAASLFGKVIQSADRGLQARSFYNLGNTRFREGKFEDALKAYRSAIDLAPGDQDAKFNYELTLQRLEDQKKPPPPEKKEEEKEEEQEQKPHPQPSPSPAQSPPPQEEKEEPEMSPEDVERLLNALLAEEEDQREIEPERRRSQPEVLRDW